MSAHQIFIHLAWTTHDRLPMINAPTSAFLWAPEYSATSVGPRQLDAVRQYLRKQAEHHPGEGIEAPVL